MNATISRPAFLRPASIVALAIKHLRSLAVAAAILCSGGFVSAQTNALVGFSSSATNSLQTAADAAQCRQNLKRIYAAIQAYRADKKQLPNWLSDLVPQYLDDANILSCPVTRRTGKINNFGLQDPKLPTSYLYEFCNASIPTNISGGSKHTMREWKQKQAELVGEDVPLVRCHHHTPQISINLAGGLFESTDSWERLFSNRVSADSLSVQKIFPAETPVQTAQTAAPPAYSAPTIIRIPARDQQASARLIDLTDYYNAGLNEPFHRVGNGNSAFDSDLAWLPKGLQSFAGTEFDVRGVVQLAGRGLNTQRYPAAVKGITINRKCSSLNFLHSTGWSVADGTRIGHYRVVYSGGEERQIPIVYGVDVRDWFVANANAAGTDPTNSVVAWMGKSPINHTPGAMLRLFKTSWENPLANARIETLDYVSAQTNCAPFLIAITAD